MTVGMAPEFVTPAAGPSERMTVSLVSSAGALRLRTNSYGFGYILHQSVEGLGVGAVENTLAPLASGGAVLRHQRLVETDMMLPIIVRSPSGPGIRQMMKALQDVLMVADGTAEILVYDPYTGEARSRRIAYRDGLATPEWKSPNSVKYGVTVDAPDPTWYGPDRTLTRGLVLTAKPFLSAHAGQSTPAAPFFPIVLASSTVEGAFELTVEGDAEAWPTWEVTGPGADLLIENVTTGDRIFVAGEFTETVTIVTRPQEQDITSPGATAGELWDRVSVDSVLFPLPPGESLVKISLVGASAASKVVMTYREAWKAGY